MLFLIRRKTPENHNVNRVPNMARCYVTMSHLDTKNCQCQNPSPNPSLNPSPNSNLNPGINPSPNRSPNLNPNPGLNLSPNLRMNSSPNPGPNLSPQTLAQTENSITESDYLFPHHPIPNATFPPNTTLLNRSTYHKSCKGSLSPCPQISWA